MSRALPKYRGPGTPPNLRWLLAVSFVLHLGIISEFPTREASALTAEKPRPVLRFTLKPPPPPGAKPPPRPTPPPMKPADKPPEKKDAPSPPPPRPEEKKEEKKEEKAPELKPPMQKVRLGGAKDHESNQKDKGALPSAQKSETAETGKGMRPKEEGAEMIAKAAEPQPSPPPPKPEEKKEEPPPPKPEEKKDPPKKEEKPKKEDPPPAKKEEKIAKKENAPGEEILQKMGGRPVRSATPATRKKQKDLSESERLLAQIRERNPEFLNDQRRPPPQPPKPQGVQTSRFVPQGPSTRGANADPFSDVQGFIPLSQALTKLSRGGPVPRIMPDGVTSNIASDGSMGMSEFREMLLEHLRRYKVWPEGFESLGIQGKTYVSCRIDGFTGELIDYRIWRSSGHAEIDQAAIQTLKRSSPFPPVGTPGTLYLDLVLQYDDQELQGI